MRTRVERGEAQWQTLAWWYGMREFDRVPEDEFSDFSLGRYLWKLVQLAAIRPMVRISGRQAALVGLGAVNVKGRFGAKQLEFLIAHRRDSDGPVRFRANRRTGRPWPIMLSADKMCDLTMFTVVKSRTTAYQSDACVIAVSPPKMDEHGTPPANRCAIRRRSYPREPEAWQPLRLRSPRHLARRLHASGFP